MDHVLSHSGKFRRCTKSKVRSKASQQIFHYRDKVHKALMAWALARPNTLCNRLCSLRSIRSCHTDIYPKENCSTPNTILDCICGKEAFPKRTWVMYIWAQSEILSPNRERWSVETGPELQVTRQGKWRVRMLREITPTAAVVYVHTLSKGITPNSLNELCKSGNCAAMPT